MNIFCYNDIIKFDTDGGERLKTLIKFHMHTYICTDFFCIIIQKKFTVHIKIVIIFVIVIN